MSYCTSRFHTLRRRTVEVKVGSVGIGGTNPIRLQSMTTSDTQDVAVTVRQSIVLAKAGSEIVRITAPNVSAAKCLKHIRAQFTAAGFGHVPLVADTHFLPSAAIEAAEHVEKIRVNPGNYADKKKFTVKEYTDNDYDHELERLNKSFSPLVKRCKELGRAMRIGTNHGSLSDRIMNHYGDTPLGMVESALEFLRIACSHDYHAIVLSMKASNPKVMIQAYRLLVERMQQEDMHYPLHLGVTEAGDGEDGRIKSAIGIGSLLLDGLGDTIRISLTEDSVYEIPVARAIANKAMSLWAAPQPEATALPLTDGVDPFHFTKRATAELQFPEKCAVGPQVIVLAPLENLPVALDLLASPRLKDTPADGLLIPLAQATELEALRGIILGRELPVSFLVFDIASGITLEQLSTLLQSFKGRVVVTRRFAATEVEALRAFVTTIRGHGHFSAPEIALEDFPLYEPLLRKIGNAGLIFTLSGLSASHAIATHAVGAYRRLLEFLRRADLRTPIWIRNTAETAVRSDSSFLSKLLEASFLTGTLLCDGAGDFVSIETEADVTRATKLAYNILQASGARISKTEFVTCPSCGRTLFDLQKTVQRVRKKTGHLKGVKLAIMGCIVNGPGEMADADFGYVGGAPGKINLYVGKTCVQYNIPQTEADARLIELIREHGKWVDPEPYHALPS